MTSGLLRRPEPPHDPRSIMLNGIVGFRRASLAPGQLAAAIDPECCAIMLPHLPAAQRDLAEPTGSLVCCPPAGSSVSTEFIRWTGCSTMRGQSREM